MKESRLKISLSSLAILISVILCLILLWHLRGLLVTLMIAVVLAATLSPIVDSAGKFVPRWLGVILAYLIIIGILVGGGLVIGPTVFTQLQRLLQKFPIYLDILANTTESLVMRIGIREPRALELIEQLLDLQALITWGVRSGQKLLLSSLGVTRGIVGGVFNLILSVLLSAYLLAGSDKLIKGFVRLFPEPWDDKIEAQFEPVTQRMGRYIQGRILVSLVLGMAITIGLKFLGINEFALGLGVIAGFTNLIPFFGPVLGSIPALIVALAQGGWVFLWVLLLFVVIQNIETYVLDPLLVGSSVKVEPLYQLLAVLGGVQVLGIIGALIVPPWIAGAGVILENLYVEPKEQLKAINKSHGKCTIDNG